MVICHLKNMFEDVKRLSRKNRACHMRKSAQLSMIQKEWWKVLFLHR